MSNQIAITSDAVPSSFCPIKDVDWQFLVALLRGTISGDPNFNYGSTTPSPANRDKPWFRLNSDGTPDRWYTFALGAWLSKHGVVPGIVTLYLGAEADLDTLDGGEAGAITSITGPFWSKVTALNARMPIGIGTLPSGALINPGDTGGEETHKLTVDELGAHRHFIANSDALVGEGVILGPSNYLLKRGGSENGNSDFAYTLRGGSTDPTLGVTSAAGADGAHNTLSPYMGVLFIQRTNRQYYRQNA